MRVAVDFETQRIGSRSDGEYPPAPVGLAIHRKGKSAYYAWGHASENNCSRAEAKSLLKSIWDQDLVFHNAAFDIEVAMTHFGLPWPKRWNDTMIMAYLVDPRARSFGLKELSEEYLGMPPEEQDSLKEWILANVADAKKSNWGAFIAQAPGSVSGIYAKGDVVRTYRLYPVFKQALIAPLPNAPDVDMVDAYERECELLKVKVDMERRGIRCDVSRLREDIPVYEEMQETFYKRLRRKLKVTAAWERQYDDGWNIDSGEHLADALEHSGYVNPREWIRTKTGKRSTSRGNLEACIKDQKIRDLLNLYNVATKYLSTFLRPWEAASDKGGYIHPSFNTTRSTDESGRVTGTTTGRLSSSAPNFQNIPASVEGSVNEATLRLFQKEMRKVGVDFIGLRDYLVPDEGCVFLNRDYSQQEFRILGHYEHGPLMERYRENPNVDFHTLVQTMVQEASGVLYNRKPIKNINFGIVYGMGAALLAEKTGLTYEEAKDLKNLILTLIPGIRHLQNDLKGFARRDEPIATHGGRLYYCEPDIIINGERRSLDYKLLNLLIQGSAADCTKQAMLQVYDAVGPKRLVLQVHDELMLSVPKGKADKYMTLMRDAMEDMNYDIPMLTEGKWGPDSWARLTPYEDKR